jgi:hypothetical protein
VMAEPPVFSKGRDLNAAAPALGPWLAPRLGVAEIEVDGFSYPKGAGVSNETILFETRSAGRVDEMVLRVAPSPEHQMFLEPEFRMQFDLLVTLRRLRSVRVPDVLWFEDDPAILGHWTRFADWALGDDIEALGYSWDDIIGLKESVVVL